MQALVGARKAVQEPLLPGVEAGLNAQNLFELLRHDAQFCADVATVEQAAATRGVTPERLLGREASWQERGKTDFIGPSFAAAWSGSPEQARETERVRNYTEQLKKRLRGA